MIGNKAGGPVGVGGVSLQDSILTMRNSSILSNTGIGAGGVQGQRSIITLRAGTTISYNGVRSRGYPGSFGEVSTGGGLRVSRTVLTVISSLIDKNFATFRGAGVYAMDESIVTLSAGTSVSGNIGGGLGGGVYVSRSVLTVSASFIRRNRVATNGGGICGVESMITLESGTSVTRNTAYNAGGGIYLLASSTLSTNGEVKIAANSARNGGGGGISSKSFSTVMLGAGVLDLNNNTAGADGGACLLSEGSTLVEKSADLTISLTISHNTAHGDGGGIAVSGDSRLVLQSTTVTVSHNAAGQVAHDGNYTGGSGTVNSTAICTSNDWADKWDDDCEAYAANPQWCHAVPESRDNCCVCGGGTIVNNSRDCEDQRDFEDFFGGGCMHYYLDPSLCGYASLWTNEDGVDALTACCACQASGQGLNGATNQV